MESTAQKHFPFCFSYLLLLCAVVCDQNDKVVRCPPLAIHGQATFCARPAECFNLPPDDEKQVGKGWEEPNNNPYLDGNDKQIKLHSSRVDVAPAAAGAAPSGARREGSGRHSIAEGSRSARRRSLLFFSFSRGSRRRSTSTATRWTVEEPSSSLSMRPAARVAAAAAAARADGVLLTTALQPPPPPPPPASGEHA